MSDNQKQKKEKLVLLDSHAILHRAYHALPDFTTHKGEPTGALYGLTAFILKVIKDVNPDYLVACFDLPKPTYRHKVYEEYKAGRAKTDDALIEQIKRSREIFQAFSIPMYEKEGFEADDLLGTIVEKVKKEKNLQTIIASGDMDTLQLVSKDDVVVYTLRKGIKDTVIYNEKEVFDRYGFSPKFLPDYKGLRGDPSDNIIGIPGIGEKTATQLVVTFGTIENIYKTLKKQPELFEKNKIKPRIIKLLEEYEEDARFSKMLATIQRDVPVSYTKPKKEWRKDINKKNIERTLSLLEFKTLLLRANETFGFEGGLKEEKEEKEERVEVFNEEDVKKGKVALWLLDSSKTNPTTEDIQTYAQEKNVTKALHKMEDEIKEKNLTKVYEEIELPLIPVVEKMNNTGIQIDSSYLKSLSKKYHKLLSKKKEEIFKQAGKEFNVNSPQQLAEILYDGLGLGGNKIKKTPKGSRSTREAELVKLKEEHPIIETVLEYRELQKLLSTYVDTIPKVLEKNGRLKTTFIQTGTTTGRMASVNPNLQNIPIRTEQGRAIRNAFVSKKGNLLASFDYSQIELRIAAVLSGDEKLLNVFKEGKDIHAAVASEIFGIPEKDVTTNMRIKAKTVNFGVLYGMGVNALRATIGGTQKEARAMYDTYFRSYPGLFEYTEKIKKDTRKSGYTTTMFGRRRYFEGITSRVPYVRASAERMAVNAPIQGSQSDVVKLSMVSTSRFLEKKGLNEKVSLILQVHDELIYEIEESLVEEIVLEIKENMESVVPLEKTKGIVFKANVSVGKSWGELEKLTI